MPSVSEKQQHFMQMVLATKCGAMKNPSPAIKKAAKSMTEKSAREFATKRKK